jgi:hypothetical protein
VVGVVPAVMVEMEEMAELGVQEEMVDQVAGKEMAEMVELEVMEEMVLTGQDMNLIR